MSVPRSSRFSIAFPVWPSCIAWSSRSTWCLSRSACRVRLVCLLLQLTGLIGFSGPSSPPPPSPSYGTRHQVDRRVEEAIVAYRQEESTRLGPRDAAKAITMTQDETLPGWFVSCVDWACQRYYILWEQAGPGTGSRHLACPDGTSPCESRLSMIQWTSDEAPGLLAYVEHHLAARHSPDIFHVRHELGRAVSAPNSHRAAGCSIRPWPRRKRTLTRIHEHLARANDELRRRGPRRSPEAATEPRAGRKRWTQPATSTSASAPARAGHARVSRPRPRLPLCRPGARHASQRQADCRDLQRHIDALRAIARQDASA